MFPRLHKIRRIFRIFKSEENKPCLSQRINLLVFAYKGSFINYVTTLGEGGGKQLCYHMIINEVKW